MKAVGSNYMIVFRNLFVQAVMSYNIAIISKFNKAIDYFQIYKAIHLSCNVSGK